MEAIHLIDKAVPLPDFTILLFFSTGDLKLLDMKPLIKQGGVWAERLSTYSAAH